jgi:peptidyl-prolyl cis-trans isomerase-like protein 2
VAATSDNQQREATQEEILTRQFQTMRKQVKKKGYVRLRTTAGDFTLELHCDRVPRTCANFLGLCAESKYDNSVFHRLIPNFMIQGGKPAAATSAEAEAVVEESLWGGTIVDEFDERLTHTGNVISMANAGPNTNKRQFFLTFKSAPHLDRKHSVFGAVVDGQDRLLKLQQIPTDKKERPREKIKILGTDVLVDPYREARELEQKRLQTLIAKRTGGNSAGQLPAVAAATTMQEQPKNQVGRYLKKPAPPAVQKNDDDESSAAIPSRLPPPPKKTTFGNFSGW